MGNFIGLCHQIHQSNPSLARIWTYTTSYITASEEVCLYEVTVRVWDLHDLFFTNEAQRMPKRYPKDAQKMPETIRRQKFA